MSAMLLMGGESHTVADDLESFLHVLSWVALRFMPHGMSAKELTDLLARVYDYSFEGDHGTTGGQAKKASLLAGTINDSGFTNHKISDLLETLTEIVAARYTKIKAVDPKKALDSNELEYAKRGSEVMLKRRELLDSGDWMLKTFRNSAADNDPPWPTDDASAENPLVGSKRKSESLAESEREMSRLALNYKSSRGSRSGALTRRSRIQTAQPQPGTSNSHKRIRRS